MASSRQKQNTATRRTTGTKTQRGAKSTGAKRGAVARQSKLSVWFLGFPWAACLGWIKRLGVLTLLGALLYGGNTLLRPVIELPVASVSFTGEIQYSDKEWLVEQVETHIAEGYWSTDLRELQSSLEKEPWVYRAAVTRVWPNELAIEIVEQSPIAHWGRLSYVNHRGEIFPVGNSVSREHLPHLNGPEDSSPLVMQRFQHLEQRLASLGLELTGLSLDRTGSWHAEINANVKLVMTEVQIDEEMDRFSKIFRKSLRDDFDKVDQIDLRYANGVAVSWQDQIASAKLEGQF